MNNEEGSSSIINDIESFLNEGKTPNGNAPVVGAKETEKERTAFIEKRVARESKLPSIQFPRSRVGINEAGKKYKDEETGDEWEVPDYGYDERTPDLPGTPEDVAKGQTPGNSLDRIFFDMEEAEWETQMRIAMKHVDQAVLVIGESGVGKTTMIEEAAETMNLKVAYFNAPTMDPYLNLVGIPNVRRDKEGRACLEFVRKHDLEHVDMIFLDEINRVSHATQNQLFELVHARTINGVPFRRLRSVWAAINPPRDDITRAVQELESALGGRFDAIVTVEAAPKIKHYIGPGRKGQIGASVAKTCLRWWYKEILNKEREGKGGQPVWLQDIVTPRVLYYIMRKVQRLNNDVFHPRPGEKAESLVWWNRGFNMIAQHHKISSKTWGVNMPYELLKRALLGDEIAALSSIRNNAPEIETRVKEAQGDETKAIQMAEMIEAGLRKTTLGGEAQIPFNEIGDFSKIISVMHPDAASKVLRQDLCWYLWAKHNKTPEWRKAFATQEGYPDDPITQPPTQGETDIYNKCKKQIDRTLETNAAAGAEKRLTPGKAAGTPGTGKVAGGLGAPPKVAGAPAKTGAPATTGAPAPGTAPRP
jgi:hypothetical protein